MKELGVCPRCGSKLDVVYSKAAFNGNGVIVRCRRCDFHSCMYASEEELYNAWCKEPVIPSRLSQVAHILGVEFNEQFIIYNRKIRMRVVLSEYGLHVLDSTAIVWKYGYRNNEYEKYEVAMVSARLLGRILIGEFLIEKIPKEEQRSLKGITLQKRVNFSRHCKYYK